MRRITDSKELLALQRELSSVREAQQSYVTLCGGTGCRTSHSEAVIAAFREQIERQGLGSRVGVIASGCHGFCERGPVVVIKPQQIFYQHVTPEDVPEIVAETVLKQRIVERLLYVDPSTGQTIAYEHQVPFYGRQKRVVLDWNGLIDPARIEDYLARGGYGSLAKALTEMTPEQVIAEISASKLRGRGGAGFPTGLKWRLCRAARGSAAGDGQLKYVVCNADEGDPGAYMDRSVMEGNPHRVLEGMIIGAYAIGARQGFVYIRNEYPLAVHHLRMAIDQARGYGLLGKNILGSGLDFDVEIRLGSGAFVCGEETALMASIEGRIGEPRPRPPFPAESGLWGRPTNINNVETWANVPLIIERGADWFRQLGTEASGGTKIFSLVGKINNTGLVEVPIGTPLGDIIFDIGGGIPRQKQFKAAQIGGPSGGCIPREHLNVPIDYMTLQELGAIMGSGGLVVCDEDTCMVDLARYFLTFVQEESCGKCLPCRVGTKAMLTTLERICRGQGREGDIEYLIELGAEIKRSSLCGLGQTAPNPVLTTLRYFRDEYEEHIREKRCRAGVCHDLVLAPCMNECPLGMDVPSYVSLIGEGRLSEALAVMLETNPFPSVCGRVCDHRCETKCRRNQLDESVAIRALKRVATDLERVRPKPSLVQRSLSGLASGQTLPKVCIVGSGPAGLSCAYFLARLGYHPTVFERLPVPGGMLAVGIPAYRLPKRVLQEEIKAIQDLGVDIRTNVTVGRDVTLAELQHQGYAAVFIAAGAHRSPRLRIPGEETKGVVSAIDFLREVNLNGGDVRLGRRVAVVGGGNAAIDAARTALRLGAEEVRILYRRTRDEMPAQRLEVEAAEAEGVEIQCLVAPVEVLSRNGCVEGIACQRMRLAEFDSSGRRRPVPMDSGGRFELELDTVISAIGQYADTDDLCSRLGVELGPGGTIRADKDGRTNVPHIFAGGDVATGPSTVVKAIAAGEHAAVAIDQYLQPDAERCYPWRERKAAETFFDPQAEPVKYGRCQLPELSPHRRRQSFDEVEMTLDRESAMREARRCLRCDYRETEE